MSISGDNSRTRLAETRGVELDIKSLKERTLPHENRSSLNPVDLQSMMRSCRGIADMIARYDPEAIESKIGASRGRVVAASENGGRGQIRA
jgi:hypothetical protein